MAAGFLHGVETIELLAGPRPIRQVRTGIIGLVGVAPVHHAANPVALNTPALIASELDAPRCGPALAGYNIPSSLATIFKYAGPVVVVNVFDPTVHKTDVPVAVQNIVAKKITLAHADLVSATVTTAADGACVAGVDYTIDRVTGIITILPGGNLAAAGTAKVAYSRANPAAVTSSDIIGAVVGSVRTGAQALLNAKTLVGAKPKILISPGYSATRLVADALLLLAGPKKLRAVVYADVPVATTRDQAIAGRNSASPVDLQIASTRLKYCFPYVRAAVGAPLEPQSAVWAGITAETDRDLGYWFSPSNKTMKGVALTEIPLTSEYSDENCDTNLLNGAGISTAFATDGAGLKTWGNRSSAFPASQDITTFMSVQRTRDAIDEAIEYYSALRADEPITDVWIKEVLADVNAFVRVLIGRGATYPGSQATFDPAKNPPVELAAGKVKFTNRHCPPPPAELTTWESIIDTSLLRIG